MRNASAVVLFLIITAVVLAEEIKPKGLTGSWRVIATESQGIRADGGSDEGPDEIWLFNKGVLTIKRPGHKEVLLTYREKREGFP